MSRLSEAKIQNMLLHHTEKTGWSMMLINVLRWSMMLIKALRWIMMFQGSPQTSQSAVAHVVLLLPFKADFRHPSFWHIGFLPLPPTHREVLGGASQDHSLASPAALWSRLSFFWWVGAPGWVPVHPKVRVLAVSPHLASPLQR